MDTSEVQVDNSRNKSRKSRERVAQTTEKSKNFFVLPDCFLIKKRFSIQWQIDAITNDKPAFCIASASFTNRQFRLFDPSGKRIAYYPVYLSAIMPDIVHNCIFTPWSAPSFREKEHRSGWKRAAVPTQTTARLKTNDRCFFWGQRSSAGKWPDYPVIFSGRSRIKAHSVK